jgi:hypothetical protein
VPQEIVPGLKFLGKRAARITGEAEEIVMLRLVEVLNQNRQSYLSRKNESSAERPCRQGGIPPCAEPSQGSDCFFAVAFTPDAS